MRGKRKAIRLRKILREMTPTERAAVLALAFMTGEALDLSDVVDDPAWWGLA